MDIFPINLGSRDMNTLYRIIESDLYDSELALDEAGILTRVKEDGEVTSSKEDAEEISKLNRSDMLKLLSSIHTYLDEALDDAINERDFLAVKWLRTSIAQIHSMRRKLQTHKAMYTSEGLLEEPDEIDTYNTFNSPVFRPTPRPKFRKLRPDIPRDLDTF